MKKLLTALSLLAFLASCKKEPETVSVTYKIIENSNFTPTYTVSYTLANGVSQSQGGINAAKWVSDKIAGFEHGKAISLSVEGNGGGEYDMYIYVDGSLQAHRIAEDGNGRQTLYFDVPY